MIGQKYLYFHKTLYSHAVKNTFAPTRIGTPVPLTCKQVCYYYTMEATG